MFGWPKKQVNAPQQLPMYADLYDVMAYKAGGRTPEPRLPMVYAFRVKEGMPSPDPRPGFALLETDGEVQEWHKIVAGQVLLNTDGHVTDGPLLQWNEIPSLLTSDYEIIVTYFPDKDDAGWPALALQVHPFGAVLGTKPARDRYYFEQNKVVGLF